MVASLNSRLESHKETEGLAWFRGERTRSVRSHMPTLMIYELGFNQDYYTFTLISLVKIILCSKFP